MTGEHNASLPQKWIPSAVFYYFMGGEINNESLNKQWKYNKILDDVE